MTPLSKKELEEIRERYEAAKTLPEYVKAGKRCSIQKSDWMSDWWVSHSPRNDNSNAEGQANHWRWLAMLILGLADPKDAPYDESKDTPEVVGRLLETIEHLQKYQQHAKDSSWRIEMSNNETTKKPEFCPSCGYTKNDQIIHGDHHLCKNAGNAPWEKPVSTPSSATPPEQILGIPIVLDETMPPGEAKLVNRDGTGVKIVSTPSSAATPGTHKFSNGCELQDDGNPYVIVRDGTIESAQCLIKLPSAELRTALAVPPSPSAEQELITKLVEALAEVVNNSRNVASKLESQVCRAPQNYPEVYQMLIYMAFDSCHKADALLSEVAEYRKEKP